MAETAAGDPRIGVTNNESAATKHLVKPYSDTPVAGLQAEGICAFCGHAAFRRSRLRFSDLLHLLALKLPVRCVRCGQRQFVAYGVASQAQAIKPQNVSPPPDKPGSWKRFTEDVPGALPDARPATTAAEPLAERLDDAFKPGPPANLGLPITPSPSVQPYVPVAPHNSAAIKPGQSARPAYTPSRRSDDSGIW